MPIDRSLEELFKEAGAAHHRASEAANSDDAQWAEWYARFLTPRLSTQFGLHVDVAVLEADLKAVDVEYRSVRPPVSWPEYYASWFRERYGWT